ncbi:DUF4437 domain-containing protein [Novipirellula aureliae]|uniref:DUF4437 domain-containing protein n=1 Tax=Novipirellula aureliae TaxID=2527966 RepID=UPI001E33C44C|nr:DUF4437 domain-containing protein [Novipirellula aureliae]
MECVSNCPPPDHFPVLPTEQAFDKGERPVNVDASDIVWLGPSSTTWIKPSATTNSSAKAAFLWGDPRSGFQLKPKAVWRGGNRFPCPIYRSRTQQFALVH